ncbi:MAG: hypothetical protein O2887_01535 [Bacteroidetes bacterium]|nr:hypothetical protein [Bacteroidota bacterium]MDA1119170.1 hypothetical protein [Bacteroidota bacterium]
MKTRGIRILGTALTVLILAGGNTLASNDENEKVKDKEITELINESSPEALYESIGIEEERISVFDLEGNLVLETKTSQLTESNYKTIFQSDLVLEVSGISYYILNQQTVK